MTALSLWQDTLPSPVAARPALPGPREADIAIVGAGYTGLWTAYYLKKADPKLRVVVLEAEYAGFGASGRNGGWCSALFPSSLSKIAKVAGSKDAAIALQRALNDTVDEVGAVAAAEGIDCHYAKGGTIVLARSKVQLERAQEEIAEFREFGFGEEDHRLLSADEARGELAATDVLGATYTPHCAAIQPARLVRGLAEVVERLGVPIYEQTPVTAIWHGEARTPYGNVTAETVVRATEGYTTTIAGFKRTLAPVYSLMLATEPLSEEQWAEIGLNRRQTFSDGRHLIIYGQRTADGRLAFGGRGAPYHFRSSIKPEYDSHAAGARRAQARARRAVPDGARGEGQSPLGRRPRRAARLVRLRRLRPGGQAGLGRGLCGRRRGPDEPGRAHAGRPDPRPTHRTDRAALGRPPLAQLGARTAALDRREPGPAGDGRRRRRGGAHRTALPARRALRQVPGKLKPRPADPWTAERTPNSPGAADRQIG